MGSIRLYGSTSGYLELQAPDVSPDSTLVLPSDSVQPGLVHLHTETFSAVSAISINGCFSSGYQNYRIIINYTSTTDSDANLRLRASGSDASGASNYIYQIQRATSTTVNAATVTSSYWNIGVDGTNISNLSMDIFSPFESVRSGFLSHSSRGGGRFNVMSGEHILSSSYDGFTVLDAIGTMTGSLSIYGYRNN